MALPPYYNPNQNIVQQDVPISQEEYANRAYSDPATMEFKRAQGASDAVARAEAARAISSARQGQQNLPQEYADMLGQSLRKISDRFENQGMFSSSNRLRAQNEEQGALQGQMLAQRNQYADTISGAGIDLAKQLAAGQMANAEHMISGADRSFKEGAQYGENPFSKAVTRTGSPASGLQYG